MKVLLIAAATAALTLAQMKPPGVSATVTSTVKNQTVDFTLTTTSKRTGNVVVATNSPMVFPFVVGRSTVFAVLKFTPPLQGAAQVKVTILKNGSFEDDRDVE